MLVFILQYERLYATPVPGRFQASTMMAPALYDQITRVELLLGAALPLPGMRHADHCTVFELADPSALYRTMAS